MLEGEVKNITEFGLFLGLDNNVDGMVHLSDLSWTEQGEVAIQKYKKGDMVRAQVLDVDVEKERISLGVKQLEKDPLAGADAVKRNDVVTCTITAVQDSGLEVKIGDDLTGFIRKVELSRDRAEQRPERFAVGEKIDAKITAIDPKTRKISLSIKAREIAEEKEAVAQYGSTDSGASLGDILGAALHRARKEAESKKDEDEEA